MHLDNFQEFMVPVAIFLFILFVVSFSSQVK